MKEWWLSPLTKFSGIPSNEKTIVRMDIPKGKGVERASELMIDTNGNGKRKVNLKMKKNEEVVLDYATTRSMADVAAEDIPVD